MKQFAATNFETSFQDVDDGVEAFRRQRGRIEELRSELAQRIARGVAGKCRLGIDLRDDPSRVVAKNQRKQIFKSGAVRAVCAEQCGGALAPGKLWFAKLGGVPVAFA